MTMTTRPIAETVHRLPVIIQDLPDLRYDNGEWMSQTRRKIAIGSILIPTLAELYEVDRMERPGNPEGYQREESTSRVGSLKRDLVDRRVDLPTAILLNLRQFNQSEHLEIGSAATELILSANDRLYVVDGQHRVRSLIALYEEEPEQWSGYALPFICLLGADRNGEITEFHVVNSNAKSIGTDLAMELLKRRSENDEVYKDLVGTGKAWMPKASRLTDRIAETTLWKGNIQLAGAKKSGTLISYNGMATSLRILVEQPGYFQSVGDEEQQCHILNAYWEGIKMVLPDTMRNPGRYNLQRTLGATALHNVLVNVLAVMVSKGFSVLEPAKYAEIMESSLTQLGETNAEGSWVEGSDFWKRGAEGASGLFNGRPGNRVLQAKILENLPPLIVT